MLDHIVVFCMEGCDFSGLGQFLHANIKLGVICHGQTLKLLLTSFRSCMKEGLECYDPAILCKLGDLICEFCSGGSVECEIDDTLGIGTFDSLFQDLCIVLRRNADRVLQNGSNTSGCGCHGLGIEIAPLGMSRITHMHMGINGTGDQILTAKIQNFLCVRDFRFRSNGNNLSGFYTNSHAFFKITI